MSSNNNSTAGSANPNEPDTIQTPTSVAIHPGAIAEEYQQRYDVQYKIVWEHCHGAGGLRPVDIGFGNEITITVPGLSPNARHTREVGEASFFQGDGWADFTCIYDFATDTFSDFEVCAAEEQYEDDTGIPHSIGEGLYEKICYMIDPNTDVVKGGIDIQHHELVAFSAGKEENGARRVVLDDNGSKLLFVRLYANGKERPDVILYCKKVVEGPRTVLTEAEKVRLGLMSSQEVAGGQAPS